MGISPKEVLPVIGGNTRVIIEGPPAFFEHTGPATIVLRGFGPPVPYSISFLFVYTPDDIFQAHLDLYVLVWSVVPGVTLHGGRQISLTPLDKCASGFVVVIVSIAIEIHANIV
ncbi:hypothetical protein MMC17_001933 [Xylographa soralifera]|nr:hypothetical protein [Xylographa soralifera]